MEQIYPPLTTVELEEATLDTTDLNEARAALARMVAGVVLVVLLILLAIAPALVIAAWRSLL